MVPSVWVGDPDCDPWERYYTRAITVLPFVFLGVSTAMSQTQPYRTLGDRLTVIGLAALAGMWVLFMYTLRPQSWRERPGPMLIYFAGLVAIGAVLEWHSIFFLAFVVTGFFHAFFVLPLISAFAGTAVTSLVIYLADPGSAFWKPDALPALLLIVGLQTLTVGGGSLMGAKGTEMHAKRRQLVRELEMALEENAGLHAQLLTQAREAGVLDERQRMAGEIHDTLAQSLTGIITQLEAAEHARRHPETWMAHVAQARALAREGLTEARRSVQALEPQSLEESRLPEAIAELARRWAGSTSVELCVETTGHPAPLLGELEVTLFRVAQEALTNVAKHARASRVGLTVSYMEDLVVLDVRDDGVGFDGSSAVHGSHSSTKGQGFGLRGMAQRLRRVGGRLEVESAPGAGTAISASVPAIPAQAAP